MSTHNRPARVAEEFRRELSALVARGLKDPRITGFVTVTGADLYVRLVASGTITDLRLL